MAAGAVGLLILLGLALLTVADDQTSSAGAPGVVPVTGALRDLYVAAAATCPGLPTEVLMAIGDVESGQGANDGPSSAGAVGPMQFEPDTFAQYALPVPPGGADPPTPWDTTDAVYAAARDLCANGARGGVDLAGAIFAYNHDTTYVDEVLSVAGVYRAAGSVTATATATAG